MLTPALQAPWEGRHCFGAVVFDEHMWIVGGDNSRGPYQTDVWKSPDGLACACLTTLSLASRRLT